MRPPEVAAGSPQDRLSEIMAHGAVLTGGNQDRFLALHQLASVFDDPRLRQVLLDQSHRAMQEAFGRSFGFPEQGMDQSELDLHRVIEANTRFQMALNFLSRSRDPQSVIVPQAE